MSSFKFKFALGAAMLISTAFGAAAADLGGDGRGSLKDSYAAPSPARWYFRLDGSYGMHDAPSMWQSGATVCGGLGGCGNATFNGSSMGDAWALGGGIGVYLAHNFRADLTYDHRFNADISTNSPNYAFPGKYNFGMKSDVVLANVYYDFVGVHDHIKPYIGVGLGVTRNEIGSGSATGIDPCGCGPFTATTAGAGETHVAAAFMAGAAVKLRENLSLDAGYRLLYLGEAHTGQTTGTYSSGATQTVADNIYARDLIANEVRVGLRYDLH